MKILGTALTSLENTKLLSKYKGRNVFSKSGEYLGKVNDVIAKKYVVAGVLVGRGKRQFALDFKYVESDTDKALMLSVDPIFSLVGKQVFDAAGKLLGRVIEVKRSTAANNYESLVVRKVPWRKPLIVEKKDVDIAKKNILLKITIGGK
ncbi:hypothetical protein GOV10_06070 [Candidatus Woesearchaeota archaeon]|nr:hypothetical protein [Candidatus Woesearchaeota archaeon]